MNIKTQYFKKIEKELKQELETNKRKESEIEEIYDKLYTFFDSYFSDGGALYFNKTEFYKNLYEKVYSNRKDTVLFWKTKKLYYIKTEANYKSIKNLELELYSDRNLYFDFDASDLKHKKNNEKKQLVFYLIDEKRDKEKSNLKFKVAYKNGVKYDKLKEYLNIADTEKLKKYLIENLNNINHPNIKIIKNNLDFNFLNFKSKTKDKAKAEFLITEEKKLFDIISIEPVISDINEIAKYLIKKNIFVSEKQKEHIEKAFRIYKKQSEIDYFINKDAESFLKEQFDLYFYNYIFRENALDTHFNEKRVKQLQDIKKIAYKAINLIADFEDELKAMWNKPKFALNSNYVIVLDKIKNIDLIKKILSNEGIKEQIKEWVDLKIVDENFDKNLILKSNKLNEKYKNLPIDTKYFKNLELEILNLFDDLDNQLNGWLIKSENYQALNTILPKFKNKVQTIYIDPPFNLGTNADFQYNVNYKDSNWITLLENRISLARDLLNEKGSMFVRCDYNGNMYVRLLMNDIFGEENFRNEIIINRKRQSIGTPNKLEIESEFLYFYSKSQKFYRKEIYEKRHLINFKWCAFLKQEERNPPERIFFGKIFYPPKDQHFSLIQSKVDKLINEHFLRLKCKECGSIYYYDEEESKEKFIEKIVKSGKNKFKFLDINPNNNVFGIKNITNCICCNSNNFNIEYLPSDEIKITDNWKDLISYSDKFGFQTENSEILLKRVIESTSNENDIVMDFFLGSGTTTATAMKLNRRFIGIEMAEQFDTVVLPRMKKVLSGDKSGISKQIKWRGGGFFKYYSLEQFEDTLLNSNYKPKNNDFANIEFKFCDKLLDKCLDIDYKNQKATYNFCNLYPNIDVAESISNILGKKIKKIQKNKIILDNGDKGFEIDLTNLDNEKYNFLKKLIWWQE
ncbi:MAG: site-specific DNA-methyltransferase [Candidatus Aenigmarchaeota archaeon ex4484_52]|nr:MAG: site-specific DNA-methyltransferase [Candidatus Aenigmarchaeota archaeon ex4484_52]